MERTMNPEVKIIAVGALFASAMGIAARIRKGERVTFMEILRCAFLSLMTGLLLGLLLYNYFADPSRVYQFWALCGLAGFGGLGLLDLLYSLLVRSIEARFSSKPNDGEN